MPSCRSPGNSSSEGRAKGRSGSEGRAEGSSGSEGRAAAPSWLHLSKEQQSREGPVQPWVASGKAPGSSTEESFLLDLALALPLVSLSVSSN